MTEMNCVRPESEWTAMYPRRLHFLHTCSKDGMSSGWGFLNMQNTREIDGSSQAHHPQWKNGHLGPILFGVPPSTAILSGYFKTKTSCRIILLINSSVFILVQKSSLKSTRETAAPYDRTSARHPSFSIQIGIWTLDSLNIVLHFLLINSNSLLLPHLLKNMA